MNQHNVIYLFITAWKALPAQLVSEMCNKYLLYMMHKYKPDK